MTDEPDATPALYVWTLRTFDGAHPKVGTLSDYARDCEMAEITGEYLVSGMVWVATEDGVLRQRAVKTERGQVTEEHMIPITYHANNETVIYFADGAA